ncbi:MAG: ribonuclease R, partial [Proteobacteria bacterium]|nr:ribonuclease R [Pseudomonadota bacterium]
ATLPAGARHDVSKNYHLCKSLKDIVQVGIYDAVNHVLLSAHRKNNRPPLSLRSAPKPSVPNLKPLDVVVFSQKATGEIDILENLGSIDKSSNYSTLALINYNLPYRFSQEALNLAEKGTIPSLDGRQDLRHLKFVTIDGEDAKDFDDAVYAEADQDLRNSGGWRIVVAIADVAYYVRPFEALDKEAYERGNSIYFPDQVVPMLPEKLSNDLCSLKPHEDRACLAVDMLISSQGDLKSYRFKRGLMRSHARLTYTQVQKALEGHVDDVTKPLLDNVLIPLYGAFKALLSNRQKRGTIDLNIPEYKVIFDHNGNIQDITKQERLESHQLIEEMMILANVAAAKTLTAKKVPFLYRIHDQPDALKVAHLRETLKNYKMSLGKGKTIPKPEHFNQVLQKVLSLPQGNFIHELVLRSQAQACYSPDNNGHYGLNLSHYTHFTSPIRRYADLIVHRALLASLDLGEGGYIIFDKGRLQEVGKYISSRERLAVTAEREVVERFMALHLKSQIGQLFEVIITGINRSGLFVRLPHNGAEGFIPVHNLKTDYFLFDEQKHRFIGRRTKKIYQLGGKLQAFLIEANPRTSHILFDVVSSYL